MKTYIDFDSVILDTVPLLFRNWKFDGEIEYSGDHKEIKFVQEQNWKYILYHAKEISESLSILKELNPESFAILTKIHSLENEGYEKIKFLRNKGVKLEILLVPFALSKTEVVPVYGNTLVDDSVKNLVDWEKCGGLPIYFNMQGRDCDNWGIENPGYRKVRTLEFLKK